MRALRAVVGLNTDPSGKRIKVRVFDNNADTVEPFQTLLVDTKAEARNYLDRLARQFKQSVTSEWTI